MLNVILKHNSKTSTALHYFRPETMKSIKNSDIIIQNDFSFNNLFITKSKFNLNEDYLDNFQTKMKTSNI